MEPCVAGVAPLVLTVNEPFSGTTSINAGTLQLGNGSSNGSVAGNIADSASLVFDNGTAQSFSGTISGPGSLTMNGATTLTLSGANSYGGGTTINSGMLLMGSATPSVRATLRWLAGAEYRQRLAHARVGPDARFRHAHRRRRCPDGRGDREHGRDGLHPRRRRVRRPAAA